jgi:hypothetical protein
MKITLIGPPNSGKRSYAVELQNKYFNGIQIEKEPDVFISNLFNNNLNIAPIVGKNIDYRTEILLASKRSIDSVKKNNIIFTHSTIDNLSHMLSIAIHDNLDEIPDQWLCAMVVIPHLANDSKSASDIFIRLPVSESADDFEVLVDKNISTCLKELNIPYYWCYDTNLPKELDRLKIKYDRDRDQA